MQLKNNSANEFMKQKTQEGSSIQNFEDILAEEKSQKESKNAFLNYGVATDFESLLDDESRKIKEQEAKDAELARKLLEEELEKQDEKRLQEALRQSVKKNNAEKAQQESKKNKRKNKKKDKQQ